MSVIIKIAIVGHICSVICFDVVSIRGFPLPQSLQAARPRFLGEGSLSFEMSVIIQIIIVGHLCPSHLLFYIGQIIGLPSPSEEARLIFCSEASLSFKLLVISHSIIEFSFSRVHSGTFLKKKLHSFP